MPLPPLLPRLFAILLAFQLLLFYSYTSFLERDSILRERNQKILGGRQLTSAQQPDVLHSNNEGPIRPDLLRRVPQEALKSNVTLKQEELDLKSSIEQLLANGIEPSQHDIDILLHQIKTAQSKKPPTLAFIHIGKTGGTAFDAVGDKVARELGWTYKGNRHFDWSAIERQVKANTTQVITLLREPVSRAISHFHFSQKCSWTTNKTLSQQNLTTFLQSGKDVLLEGRDIWQDGQAAVAWLTGTHIGNWVGIPAHQVDDRERQSLNFEKMCHLAADRLEQTRWFGLLEDLDRSLELLQHTFHLSAKPTMKQGGPSPKTSGNVSEQDKATLSSLMPQDLWLYKYATLLFEARWNEYRSGLPLQLPERHPLPKMTCVSTRLELNCTSGPLVGII